MGNPHCLPFYSILTHQNCDLTNHHGMQFRLAPHINEMFDVNLGEVGLDLCFDVVVNRYVVWNCNLKCVFR